MFEVPESSTASIKRLDKYGTPRAFYKDLVQIVVGNYSVIYNISQVDDIYEVQSM